MSEFTHSSLASPLFRVGEVLEVDVALGDEVVTWRIELLQDVNDAGVFRYRALQLEFFRLRPSFPQDPSGEPLDACDDQMFAYRPIPRERSDALSFRAPSIEAARDYALADLRASLEHITAARPDDE